jgi:cell wall-associated NlpC family hydrolase
MISTEFAQLCRTYVGVRFLEGGRDPKQGLDCVGVIGAALNELGIPFEDEPHYCLNFGVDNYALICRRLASAFALVQGPWMVGDVIAYRHRLCTGHALVYVGEMGGTPFVVESVRGKRVQLRPVEALWKERVLESGGEWSAWRLG